MAAFDPSIYVKLIDDQFAFSIKSSAHFFSPTIRFHFCFVSVFALFLSLVAAAAATAPSVVVVVTVVIAVAVAAVSVAAAAAAVAIVFSTEIAPFGRRNPPHCRTLSRSSCPVSRAHPPTFSPFCSILAGLKSRVVPFPLNCVIMQKALCLHLHRSIVARHRMHPYVTDVRGGGEGLRKRAQWPSLTAFL